MIHEVSKQNESLFSDSLEGSESNNLKHSVRNKKKGSRYLSNIYNIKSNDQQLSRTVEDLKHSLVLKS